MSDVLTPEQRHRNMVAIHSTSTKPEIKLRRALWRQGFRYRVNDKKLPGKPDIVLPKYRTVIFVHGCFWHGHRGCRFFTVPKTNTSFWTEKIARNQERDQEVWRQLEAMGWSVIIIWECQMAGARFADTLTETVNILQQNISYLVHFQEERKKSRVTYYEERKRRKIVAESIKVELSCKD